MTLARCSFTTSPEAGLYRCGSTPAPIMPTTLTRSPPTSFTMSVTMVVVATTFILAKVDCVRPAAAINPSVNDTMCFVFKITRITPFLRITWQFSQRPFTDGIAFIFFLVIKTPPAKPTGPAGVLSLVKAGDQRSRCVDIREPIALSDWMSHQSNQMHL